MIYLIINEDSYVPYCYEINKLKAFKKCEELNRKYKDNSISFISIAVHKGEEERV